MIWLDIILRSIFILALVYLGRVIIQRERVLRQPVQYLVTYFRYGSNGIGYGSCGIDVRGGITPDKLEEVTNLLRTKTGLPDAFVMGFSRYE